MEKYFLIQYQYVRTEGGVTMGVQGMKREGVRERGSTGEAGSSYTECEEGKESGCGTEGDREV